MALKPVSSSSSGIHDGQAKVNECGAGSPLAGVAIMVRCRWRLVLCETLVEFSTRVF